MRNRSCANAASATETPPLGGASANAASATETPPYVRAGAIMSFYVTRSGPGSRTKAN